MSFWQNRRVVVSGGSGFLGSFVVKNLCAAGCREITVPLSREYDLREKSEALRLYKDARPDVFIHLAAVVGGIGANQANPGRFFYDNAAMGLHVIEAAQESVKESGIWMPFWYRDARLIGVYRLAYLIKGRMRFYGALMMDTAPRYHTLSWVWLTPRLRRRGIFTAIWRSLEQCHREFKVLAPLSAAMRGFLARENTAESHEIVTETGGPLV